MSPLDVAAGEANRIRGLAGVLEVSLIVTDAASPT